MIVAELPMCLLAHQLSKRERINMSTYQRINFPKLHLHFRAGMHTVFRMAGANTDLHILLAKPAQYCHALADQVHAPAHMSILLLALPAISNADAIVADLN